MTYCLGILLPSGLVLASDSRSNAGVDQFTSVRKLSIFESPKKKVIVILSAGNLATSQAVVTTLRQSLKSDVKRRDLFTARTMFDAAKIVGDMLREVLDRDGKHVEPHGDPNAGFLVGGQIAGDSHRLFEVYSAGNFVEASARSRMLQIGETKYGKPVLDRALSGDNTLDEAAKLALLSFDATIRSNLSVEAPIDLLRYEADSFSSANLQRFERDDPYWSDLRRRYSKGFLKVVQSLPTPPRENLPPAVAKRYK